MTPIRSTQLNTLFRASLLSLAVLSAVPVPAACPLPAVPDWTADSNVVYAWFGETVEPAGDVNGDGYGDVIAGSSWYNNGTSNEGMVFVYLGSPSGLSSTPSWHVESNVENDQLGFSAAAGDVNGDGYNDVIVSSPKDYVYVFMGSASGLSPVAAVTLSSGQAYSGFGVCASSAGDVNGDGYDDVIVGANLYDNGQFNEGKAFLYMGSASGLQNTPAWTAEPDQAGADFGFAVSSAGDVNGDGYGDVIVGAFQYDNDTIDEGRVYVYLGSSLGLSMAPSWTAESDQEDSYFGLAVASAGDVNGDGYDDIVVGADLYDDTLTGQGRVYCYLGSAAGLPSSPSWTAESDQAGALYGVSVASAGDVNGDGYDDVIVGSSWYDNGQTDEGRAFLYLGTPSGLQCAAAWMTEGNQADAGLGLDVNSAGDVNGDGYDEVIVGAPYYNNGTNEEGQVRLFMGSSCAVPTITCPVTASPTPTVTWTPTRTPTPAATATPTSTSVPSTTPTPSPTPGGLPPGIYPNPSDGTEPVVLVLPPGTAGDVDVKVFTTAFRLVSLQKVPDAALAGWVVPLSMRDRKGALLSNGVYYVVADSWGGRYVAKWMILR